MSNIAIAIVSIISALIFYSIAVWSEKFSSRLKWWHLGFFYLGLFADTNGTSYMTILADGLKLKAHTLTGIFALIIMLVHTVWATVVLIKKDERALLSFHKYSLIAWLFWLIPFVSGMLISIPK